MMYWRGGGTHLGGLLCVQPLAHELGIVVQEVVQAVFHARNQLRLHPET